MHAQSLPPGPPFAALQTLRFVRDAKSFFLGSTRRYGDPFTVHLAIGTAVVTGTPEGIKEIFTAEPDTFEPFGQKNLGFLIGQHSLILLSGTEHKRERRLLMPPFHGERMRAYGALMQKITLEHTDHLKRGEALVAQDITQRISLDVIIEAVFGVTEPAEVERFRRMLVEYVNEMKAPLIFFSFLRRPFLGLSPWDRFQRVSARFDRMLQAQIDKRRKSGDEQRDILSLLLGARDEEGKPLSDSDLKDELRTMLIAGHETTAIGMAWALFWIHQNPAVKQKLLDEITALGPTPDPEALSHLPYLDAVCSEALRLYPVLPMVTRRLLKPFSLRGYELSPNMGVFASIILAHNNPDVFPEPQTFRPERFLERKFSPFEYLPFGGGARRCLGAAFALFEMKIALGTLLSRHRLSLVSNRIPRVVRRNLTLGPEGGVPMIHQGEAWT